jgi:hypothetical protein
MCHCPPRFAAPRRGADRRLADLRFEDFFLERFAIASSRTARIKILESGRTISRDG